MLKSSIICERENLRTLYQYAIYMNKKSGIVEYNRQFVDGLIYSTLISILVAFVVASYMKLNIFSDEALIGIMVSSTIAIIVIVAIIAWKKKR